ncbi:MAG: hypothetical protein OZSIB_0070 [Candidatus Ozemobacter sibiricus]|uniref:Peptidase C39-like domain-containing protein n=1 Tax=Candidatus Ozemobacter sibiricus TaxID=2268124 RepID=A0A367ZN07_9BACT|nr:MAG: hypothetical protein OZSIB_0070 [Candidatus Ozemobacter sibiricus]
MRFPTRIVLAALSVVVALAPAVSAGSPFTDEEISIPGISNLDTTESTPTAPAVQPTSPVPPLQGDPVGMGQPTARDVRTSIKLINGYLSAGDLDAAIARVKKMREQAKGVNDLTQVDRWDMDLAEKQVIVGITTRIVERLAQLETQAKNLTTPTSELVAAIAELRKLLQALRDLAGNSYDAFLVVIQTRLDQIASSFTYQRDLALLDQQINQARWEEAERTLRHLKGIVAANPNLSSLNDQVKLYETRIVRAIVGEIRTGLDEVERLRQGGDVRRLAAAIQKVEKWLLVLERMDLPAYRDFVKQAREQLNKGKNDLQVDANQVNIPYLSMHNNSWVPDSSCQNTCLGMMFAAYGIKISPDYLSQWVGFRQTATPMGAAEVFNHHAERSKVPVRARGQIVKFAEFERLVKEGKQMIVYGNFAPNHAVIINRFDGKAYDVMDPGGKWNQQVNGTHDKNVSGAHQKYDKAAFDRAINRDGEVWVVTFEKSN